MDCCVDHYVDGLPYIELHLRWTSALTTTLIEFPTSNCNVDGQLP